MLGSLQWQSAFQAAAFGQTLEGRWRFKLQGIVFKQWVRIEPPEGSEERAVFQARPSFSGTLEYGDGRAFHWDSNFWLTSWIWSDEEGIELMRVERTLSLRAEGFVRIDPPALERPEIPLLTLLGWYLIMLLSDLRPG